MQALLREVAKEIALRKRRALVGRVRLRPDQGDPPAMPKVAQFGGDGKACLPGTDDHDRAVFYRSVLHDWLAALAGPQRRDRLQRRGDQGVALPR